MIKIVRPGGYVYVGDIRSLPLLPSFSCSIEMFQAFGGRPHGVDAQELRARIRRRMERETELVLSPAYFLRPWRWLPANISRKISRVEIRPLGGHADNEMTRYRYQVIIRVGDEPEPPSRHEFLDWTEREWTLGDIRSALRQYPNRCIGFRGIRNARIEKDLAALAILRNPALTLREIGREVEEYVEKGILPQALTRLEREGLGFKVFLSWASCQPDGSYDALFIPVHLLQGKTWPTIDWPQPDASALVRVANAPGQRKLRNQLTDQLVALCSQNLPERMVPRDVTLVDVLAPTPGGDVDPAALLAARAASRSF